MKTHLFYQRFKKNKAAALSLSFLLTLTFLALIAPWVSHQTYDAQNLNELLQTPSFHHLMGTDPLGRDLYSRTLFGARMSLAVGFVTAVFSLLIGTLTGAWAGYFGGGWDRLLMRIVDIFSIFPMLLMAILLTLVFGRGFTGLLLAIGFSAWVTQARMIRGLVLQLRQEPYIEAAEAMGNTSVEIIFKHIIPNLMGPALVSLSLQVPTNIMAESFLSFIGLGVQPPYASWGTLANEGFRAMQTYPHLIIFPGLALFLTLLAFYYLANGLRDLLDPRLKNLTRSSDRI